MTRSRSTWPGVLRLTEPRSSADFFAPCRAPVRQPFQGWGYFFKPLT